MISSLLCVWGGLALAGPSALVPDGRDAAVPSRRFDILTLNLDLTIDFPGRSIGGTATYTVQKLVDGDLVLDQVGLNIKAVTVDGEPTDFRTPGKTLVIEMPERLERHGQAEVAIDYMAKPRTGLHFRDTRRDSPDAYPEVWTQGQGNDNRYWFPAWDHPNDRFDYTGSIRGPDGWKIHTNSGVNLPSYLIMIAGGPYTELGDKMNRVWVGPGSPERGVKRVWEPVPDMMQHFEARTGVAYPWDGYLQVFVQRFMYGGMENTSATINADSVVSGERVDDTRTRIQSIVAHELAHQWFGDWLTCRTWRDLWLNEGFATFFGDDWLARRDGPERWAFEVLNNFAWSQNEKPLAGRFFHGQDASTNHNVYAKGASVLQMLRVMLGEETFWEGIRKYTKANGASLVETIDLQRAMEEVSGSELGWFFQQWVELPHVPRLAVKHSYGDGRLTIAVTQEVSDERPRYTVPFEVEIGTKSGPIERRGVIDDEKTQIEIPMDEPPTYVAWDPRGGVLCKLTHEQDPEAWGEQTRSSHPVAVLRALRALAETSHTHPAEGLLRDLDTHFLVRAEAAKTLGEQGAVGVLRDFADDKHDEVRRAAIRALGEGLDATDLPLLERRMRSDRNADVRIAALAAITQLSRGRGAQLARGALSSADLEMVKKATYILGEHGKVGDLSLLLSRKVRAQVRTAGFRAAASIARKAEDGKAQEAAMRQLTRALIPLLTDLDVRARQTAVSLLGEVGDYQAIPHLEAIRRVETVEGLAESARNAIDKIRQRQKKPKVAGEENAHEARMKALEQRLDEIEAKLTAAEDRH